MNPKIRTVALLAIGIILGIAAVMSGFWMGVNDNGIPAEHFCQAYDGHLAYDVPSNGIESCLCDDNRVVFRVHWHTRQISWVDRTPCAVMR